MQPGAEVIGEPGRGDLDQFLPPPLQAAVAVAEHGDRGAIPDDLHFDVPGLGQQLLHVHRGIAEGRLRFGGAAPDRLVQAGRVEYRPHAAAPASGDRLHHHRGAGAEAGQERARLPGIGRAVRGPGQRDPEVGGAGPRGGLVAEQVEHLRRRPGEAEAGRGAGPGERAVLGQEAVAGMQGVTPRAGGGLDDRADVEIGGRARTRQAHRSARPGHMGAGRVVVRVDRDGVDAEHGRGGHDAHRDLRPVRDEQLHRARLRSSIGGRPAKASTSSGSGHLRRTLRRPRSPRSPGSGRRAGAAGPPGQMVRGQPRATPAPVTRGGAQGGDGLAGDEPVLAGELVDDGEGGGDPLRGVDHDGHHGHMAAQLQDAVAVRRVVAVEPPDPAQGGGTADPRGAQPPDHGAMHRLAAVLGRLGAEDHELVPQRHAVLVGGRQRGGRGEEPPVTLAHLDPFEGGQRAAQQRAQLGQHLPDPVPGPHGDHHHRHLGVAAEEPGPFPPAARRAVHAEQRGGAGHAPAVQQVTDRHEGGHPVDPFLAAEIDGELALPGQVPRAGGEPGPGERARSR